MAEHQELKNIETDLKRMLNMNVGETFPKVPYSQDQKEQKASISKTDLANVKASNATQPKKKKTKGKAKVNVIVTESKGNESLYHDNQVNNSALDNKHEEDKDASGNTIYIHVQHNEESDVKKKKKKKRLRKKKTKDKAGNDPIELDESESESEEEEEPRPLERQKESNEPIHYYGYQPKFLDGKLTPPVMKELEAQRIYPLKKKSAPFPKALYFCRLCDYHCDNIPVCRQHISDARHRRRLEIMIQDKKFKSLPTPSKEHYSALTTILERIYKEQGLSDEEMKDRESIAELLQEFLQETIPGLELRIYGSSLTGSGLKQSDLNMDLVLPSGTNQAKGLSLVFKTLKQSDLCKNVRSNFEAKVPSVLFKSPCGTVNCEIAIGSDSAYFTSRYLNLYNKLDSRLRKLIVIFKYWAKICELDDQGNGSLPSYCYDLMTLYFLQQVNPKVLPVLWKDLSEESLRRPKTHKDIFDMLEELQKQPWKCSNDDSLGLLWRDLLLFYAVKFEMAETVVCVRSHKILRRHEKKWKSRRVAIEDPFSQKRNVARSMHNTRVFDYFYNCLRKAGLYFSIPTSKKCFLHEDKNNEKMGNQKEKTPSVNQHISESDKVNTACQKTDKDSVGVNEHTTLACVRDTESEGSGLTGTESDASIKPHFLMEKTNEGAMEISELDESGELVDKLDDSSPDDIMVVNGENSGADAIECSSSGDNLPEISAEGDTGECNDCDKSVNDEPKRSNSDSSVGMSQTDTAGHISEQATCDLTDTSSSKTVDTDKSPHHAVNLDSSVDSEIITTSPIKAETSDIKGSVEIVDQRDATGSKETVLKNSVNKEEEVIKCVEIEMIQEGTKESKSDVVDCIMVSDSNTESDMEAETSDSSPLAVKRKKVPSSYQTADNQYNFVFCSQTLTDGKGPSTFCQICDKEGHHKNNCPEDQLPCIQELPPLTQKHDEILSRVIEKVPKDFSLSKEEIGEREYFRKNIELHLRDDFPDCELRLFGSSKNGFGFHQSDLDICVTFKHKTQKEVNFIECIDAIAKRLKTHRGVYNVFPITTAKVPIVKFKHRSSQLEGDISMYNVLALQNTKLLHTYACIDKRAVILGYAIKVFAKVCDIGDASKGSLSSYAYMLLMFHYLQQTKPPVLPVLQELRGENTKERELMIDGWNAWFYEDLDSIPKVWPGYGKNKQSVGELWLGFFRYYMEEFHIAGQVVTIKQFEPLTKFEKLWNGKCLAIEDPFDLGHNLGGGLSRRMNQFILRTFIHAREMYGKPIDAVPNGFDTPEDYFFDQTQLTEGKPPADRLCRVCSKIGHFAKECPRLLARKEREAADRKRRQEMKQSQENNNNSHNVQNHRGNSGNQRQSSALRSHSDPADFGSPNRTGNSQMYHRQQSDSLDHRQVNPRQDGYQQRYNWSSSPQSTQGQGHSYQNRNPQPQSPNTSTAYGHKQPPRQYHHRTGHPSNLFNRPNQNEFTNSRNTFSANQTSANQMRHTPNIPANQYRDYSSPPNSNAGYMSRGGPQSEGPRQPQGKRPERVVNINNNSGPLPDVGITVKNDLCKITKHNKD